MSAHSAIQNLQARMSQDIVGQEKVLERIVIGLLANGNLLVEGLPGRAAVMVLGAGDIEDVREELCGQIARRAPRIVPGA